MMYVAFSFLGEHEIRKKRERLSVGLGYDPDNKIEVFLQFFQGEGGTPHGMKNYVLTLYLL